MSIWVKICANTSLEDARLAAEAGADAVGFVFAPSKRQVTVEQVAAIVPALPIAVEKIGVFAADSADRIEAAAQACGLTGIQLHFDAPLELTAELSARLGSARKILRVLHFGSEPLDAAALARLADPCADAVLIDSRSAKGTGGTGETFDWMAASQSLFREARERGVKLIVAGGLDPANVAEAIRILAPWGVDIASGVEATPGRKDHTKVRDFIAYARAAEGQSHFKMREAML